MKLRLDYETEPNKWGDRTELVIYKDGVEFFRGPYGGEPEDNSHYRNYSWVREAIAAVVAELGAEVERTHSEAKDEDDEDEALKGTVADPAFGDPEGFGGSDYP